jgi:hypothetical protein
MKPFVSRAVLLLMPTLLIIAGCASSDESRLQRTWKSNCQATVAATFEKDPRWTKATPEHIKRFKNLFGKLTITRSNRVMRMHLLQQIHSRSSEQETVVRYRVVGQGKEFVAIYPDEGLGKGDKFRIRCVGNGTGYWREAFFGAGPEEKFDRVATKLRRP